MSSLQPPKISNEGTPVPPITTAKNGFRKNKKNADESPNDFNYQI